MQKIFITGITGQDGVFLTSKLLKDKKVKVYGSSRKFNNSSFYKKLEKLNIGSDENLFISKLNLLNVDELSKFIEDIKPDAIVNLSGPSSVYKSLGDEGKSHDEIVSIFDNIIEAVKINSLNPTIFQASSSEMFKSSDLGIFDESSELEGLTPYAEAKVSNHKKSINLNENDGWKIHSGIMFNHESEFRDEAYLIMQIINSAKKIIRDKGGTFNIGSMDLIRDWSFAGDISEAILKIITEGKSNSYVIGSGIGTSVKKVVEIIFKYFDLEYEEFLVLDPSLNREKNTYKIVSNPLKIKQELNWKSIMSIEDLVVRCIEKKL